MAKFTHHIFICTQPRDGSGRSCQTAGGSELVQELQRQVISNPDLLGKTAVTACACLGPCLDGPNMVIYPEGIWYAGVTLSDIPDIIDQHLANGTPVARLQYEWDED